MGYLRSGNKSCVRFDFNWLESASSCCHAAISAYTGVWGLLPEIKNDLDLLLTIVAIIFQRISVWCIVLHALSLIEYYYIIAEKREVVNP